ncbi:hypothetical protein [Thermococcus siculi]|nr:hypothetical protein [Thermococcus siculi]
MVKAKGETLKSSVMPPWKSKLMGWTKAGAGAEAWFCVDCGVVLHYVKEEDLKVLKEEFEALSSGTEKDQ